MKRIPLFCACLALPAWVQAGASCEDRLDRWAQEWGPDRAYESRTASCKAWPANPALTLAAIPFPQEGSEFDVAVYDLLVIVADSASGEVEAHVLHESALKNISVNDRPMLMQPLDIDTAPFQLTPATRAFGVRASHSNHSALPADSTSLNLYVIEGETLRPVLTQMRTFASYAELPDCRGKYYSTDRKIGLGAPGKDGYANLLVTEKVTYVVMMSTPYECKDKPGPVKRAKYTLKYGGGQYLLPKGLSNGD